MAIESKALPRAFKYNSVDLKDPGIQFSVTDVRDIYSATYPEIVSAAVEGPEQKNGELVYTFRKAVGTKGAVTTPDLRARLEATIAGRTHRAAGHSVTAAEHAASGKFAQACARLVNDSSGGFSRYEETDKEDRACAPSHALPPLP